MATVEKVKRKKEKSKIIPTSDAVAPIEDPSTSVSNKSSPPSSDAGNSSQPGSVISVREAARRDKSDTIKNGSDPGISSASNSRPSSARPSSAGSERPASAASTTSTLRASSPRPPSAVPGPSSLTPVAESRPNSAASHRSYRKNKNNVVQPGPSNGTPSVSRSQSFMGSSVSIRSKEAWMQDEEKPWPVNGEDSVSLNGYKQSPDEISLSKSTASLFGPPDLNLAHAYIPYLYARDCIAKMVEDMKKMKTGHISIVNGIEANYKSIEGETQGQFNLFVLGLQNQYGHKVKTFRQVVEVHRLELQQKQQYWDEALSSMSAKNKRLLEDKKMLLIQNKVEFERLEKEKAMAVGGLTQRLDEIQRDVPLMATIGTMVSRPQSAQSVKEVAAPPPLMRQPTVIVTDLSEEERRRMEEERQRMAEERQKMAEEREEWARDRDGFLDERTKFQEDRVILQGDLNTANKDKETWKAKYEDLKDQLEELGDLRAKYNALEAQFAAMAAVATVSSEDGQKKAEEKIQAAAEDIVIMEEEKKTLEEDLKAWQDDFKQEFGREPTKLDMSDSAKEMEASLQEANNMITNLNAQIDTMDKLKKGEIPEPPKVETIIVKEPEIRTITVKIPDPEVVAALEMTQAELEAMKKQLLAMKADKSRLLDVNSKLEGEVSDLTRNAAQLEAVNKELERLLAMREPNADPADLSDLERRLAEALAQVAALKEREQELEKELQEKDLEHDRKMKELEKEHENVLKQKEEEKRDMEKDIKKLLKHIDKLRKKLAALQGNEPVEPENLEDKVNELEDKVSDLEADKEHLTDDNKGLEDKLEKLEKELAEAQDKLVGLVVPVPTDDLDDLKNSIEDKDQKIADLIAALALSKANEGENEILQKQLDRAEAELREERSDHEIIREELFAMRRQLMAVKAELENQKGEAEAKFDGMKTMKNAEIENLKKKLADLEEQVAKMDAERLKDVPVDTVHEIKQLKAKVTYAEKDRDMIDMELATMAAQIRELKSKIKSLENTNKMQKSDTSDAEQNLRALKAEHSEEMKRLQAQLDRKSKETTQKLKRKIDALEQTILELDGVAAAGAVSKPQAGKGGADPKQMQELKDKLRDAKKENSELKTRIKQLEADMKRGGLVSAGGGGGADTDRLLKKQEKLAKELEKRLDNEQKKNKKNDENLRNKDEDLTAANKDNKKKDAEIAKLKAELGSLGMAAKEGVEMAQKVKQLEKETKKLTEENKTLADSFNSERVLRKKYYNMVEDMKGKIRVYCRVRPISQSEKARGNTVVCKSPDEFSITMDTSRGTKEFQFDTVFMPNSAQDKVFEDTNNLIQSAVDGYNVCIFAYGQTGSGKTFTIIGDREQSCPGIAPRAFSRVFELLEENKAKFKYKVSCYMLELYNDKLLDLFAKAGAAHDEKLDIKKDKKGLVYVPGSEVKSARNAKELFALFEEGSKTRHTASTKMNAESSRSHLVIGILIETTNKSTGQVLKGKLSLVDLAGSERAAKTEAGAEQLKEAMSINKSLSALGDVISALSSEQSFIPYRNNKLTMLMQDSLGGNAKTLMFVNISPADYNIDESVISLTYASRVKLITNDAQKNSDNKEIARLKAVILKMKKGDTVHEDEED